jgi:hypothetical protein
MGFSPSVDIFAQKHHNVSMRTTVDIPDNLYRALKARAGLSGVTLRELVQQLIEQGLRYPLTSTTVTRRAAPPVIVPPRGVPIPAVSRAELTRMEEEEDESKHA